MFQFDNVKSSSERRPIGATASLANRYQCIMIAEINGRDEVLAAITDIGGDTEIAITFKDDSIRRVYRRGQSIEQNIGSALAYLGIIQEEQDVNAVDLFMELVKYYALEQYKFLMIGGGSQWPEIRCIKVR